MTIRTSYQPSSSLFLMLCFNEERIYLGLSDSFLLKCMNRSHSFFLNICYCQILTSLSLWPSSSLQHPWKEHLQFSVDCTVLQSSCLQRGTFFCLLQSPLLPHSFAHRYAQSLIACAPTWMESGPFTSTKPL